LAADEGFGGREIFSRNDFENAFFNSVETLPVTAGVRMFDDVRNRFTRRSWFWNSSRHSCKG
jgi:hypothetical protein